MACRKPTLMRLRFGGSGVLRRELPGYHLFEILNGGKNK